MANSIQEPPFALPYETIIHGRYVVNEVLGHGGFGITYKGVDLKENRVVAIKEYYPNGNASRTPGQTKVQVHSNYDIYRAEMDKFLQEARIIYHCNSGNILEIYSLFEENNTAYYVMEFLNGRDLKQLIKEHGGKISWSILHPILMGMLDALALVHREGIIHRDISPDNIFICDDGSAKLIDFGTARNIFENKSLSVILKKGYAPPEQYSSHGNQGPWTDLYALAGTAYRALSGSMPPESIERVRKDTIVPLERCGSDAPNRVNSAIMKALSITETDRYSTADQFKAAIDETPFSKTYAKTEVSNLMGGITRFLGIRGTAAKGAQALTEAIRAGFDEQKASIHFMTGIYNGQTISLDHDLVFGRNANQCNVIFPADVTDVSRIHCQICISKESREIVVVDCGSSNGTYVNGIRIAPGVAYILKDGDIITLGSFIRFVFNLG